VGQISIVVDIWPFIRHEDYAAALQRPKLLASALA
jgi:hypothetical protein